MNERAECAPRVRRTGLLCAGMSIGLALLQMGCVDWTTIRPTELTKLNRSFTQTVGSTSSFQNGRVVSTPVIAMTNIPVERPDGTTVMIRGEVRGARIQTGAQTVRVSTPVLAEVQGEQMRVRGGNMPPTIYEIQDIDRVQVGTRNQAKTTVLTTFIGLAIGAIAAGIIVTQI